jgi:hypothetical protein
MWRMTKRESKFSKKLTGLAERLAKLIVIGHRDNVFVTREESQ